MKSESKKPPIWISRSFVDGKYVITDSSGGSLKYESEVERDKKYNNMVKVRDKMLRHKLKNMAVEKEKV